jgi:hypothetical protein
MAELVTDQMNLIIQSGIPPKRLGVALQVLLEKVAGDCSVDRLRSIQLYEADFNWSNSHIFHHQAMDSLRKLGFLPEEHYSQKESLAEDACFDKILTFDISRQSRSPLSITSVDAAQCYDRVNHIMMGLVWMALGVSQSAISIMISCLSNMSIYTRTGFGDSLQCFGGSGQSVSFCGLGQGSKAAPASWIQLSSAILHAFKQRAHGASFCDPITNKITHSNGCVFVDDTELFTAGPDLTTVEEVVSATRQDAPLYSGLLSSTGSAIKDGKSGWHLIDHVCKDGVWHVTDPEYDLKVPISAEETVTLTRYACTDAIKSLGVFTCPSGGHQTHLDMLCGKVKQWCSRISNGHLPASQVMMSYHFQLWPSLRYGLGALTNDWESALSCLEQTDFVILPLLGVNRNLNKSLCQLHYTFGGIGLFNLAVEQHICRVNLFCQHYGSQSIVGKKLMTSLHWLQLQIGCEGCPLLEDFATWGRLAPTSWIHSFWESLHQYPCSMDIQYEGVPLQRAGDITLMGLAHTYGLSGDSLLSFNCCRCYGNLLFLSDIVNASGTGVDSRFLVDGFRPLESRLSFPPECPTLRDWEVWKGFWLKRSTEVFRSPLGAWICNPHFVWHCYYVRETDLLYMYVDGEYEEWKQREGRTRLERGYVATGKRAGNPGGVPASVQRIDIRGEPRLLVSCTGPPFPTPTSQANPSLWDILFSWGGQWMWESIQFDREGSDTSWLLTAFCNGTLIGVADGSYDRVRAPRICGTGWILCNRLTRRTLAGSFTEVSSSASSFRGEMLGLCAMHFLCLALEEVSACVSSQVTISCDNVVAVNRANARTRRVKPRWACADILRSFRNIRPLLQTELVFKYVQSHMDDLVSWDKLSLEEQLNCQCDKLAKDAVRARRLVSEDRPIDYTLPKELVSVKVLGEKITGDPSHILRQLIGRVQAKSFFINQKKWSERQFEEVAWEHLHMVLSRKGTGFRLWLAKQTSDFCATGVQMVRCRMADDSRCPSCWKPRERADHLCKCPSEARTQLLESAVDGLCRWMESDDRTDPELCYWLPRYIRGRGALSFTELGTFSNRMEAAAQSQDLIGWRRFMEGRVSV